MSAGVRTAPAVGPGRFRTWARDLGLGARFAVGGGRSGWTRMVLTGIGVGLGVAMLLLGSSVPNLLGERAAREQARQGVGAGPEELSRSEHSVLNSDANTQYRGEELHGRLLQPEGSTPVLPPGVEQMPGPGEMVVSPALQRLLDADRGKDLVQRLDARIIGVIGDDGLLGPGEMAFYQGTDQLTPDDTLRTDSFGSVQQERPLDPALLLLVVVACVVLVMPIAVFIATAVRFGGEQRDRRLAALRLIGADAATTRRMAAGEALVGALLGLLLGAWFFLLGRVFIGRVRLLGLSAFPADVTPAVPLTVLLLILVPVAAVLVSLFALRGIAIEPLGVVRQSVARPRRLWWRLLPPVAGLLLLLPLAGSVAGRAASVGEQQVVAGVVLLLSGVALLLPWVVERIVRRLHGGPVSWQLAVRRLQLSSGQATRAVSGITIAVAGAIALQLLLSSVEQAETKATGQDPGRAQLSIWGASSTAERVARLDADLGRTHGVRDALVYARGYAGNRSSENDDGTAVLVAECPTLRELAGIRSCREGQAFLSSGPDEDMTPPRAGDVLDLRGADGGDSADTDGNGEGGSPLWRVPQDAEKVRAADTPDAVPTHGLLVTPSALASRDVLFTTYQGWVRLDPGDPDAVERVRTAVFHVDPEISLMEAAPTTTSETFQELRRGILAAAAGVLLLIGASMIVTMAEQLRERKRQLSVLVAFGTRRATLAYSVLWQTAIPVALGMVLAVAFGLGLGRALLALIGRSVGDWLVFLPVAGVGLGVIALVTLLSLPSLWRLMRPDGLRTE